MTDSNYRSHLEPERRERYDYWAKVHKKRELALRMIYDQKHVQARMLFEQLEELFLSQDMPNNARTMRMYLRMC